MCFVGSPARVLEKAPLQNKGELLSEDRQFLDPGPPSMLGLYLHCRVDVGTFLGFLSSNQLNLEKNLSALERSPSYVCFHFAYVCL